MNTRNGGEIGTLVTLMRCDMRIPVKPEITQWQKHHNMMEIIDHAAREFTIARRKKQNKLTEYLD